MTSSSPVEEVTAGVTLLSVSSPAGVSGTAVRFVGALLVLLRMRSLDGVGISVLMPLNFDKNAVRMR